MGLYLSNKDLVALRHASTVLLDPFAFDDATAWQRAVCEATQALLQADAASTALPAAGKTIIGGEPDVINALRDILPPPDWVSDGLLVQSDRQLNVADWSDVFDVEKVRRSSFYNDVVRPARLLAPIHVMEDARAGEVQGSVTVYYEDDDRALARVQERKAKLQLLVPAIQAGIRAYVRFAHERAAAGDIAERAQSGIVVCDENGAIVFANEFFSRLMAGEPERDRVRREVVATAANVVAFMMRKTSSSPSIRRFSSSLRTQLTQYSITAIFLADSWTRHGAATAVLIESTKLSGVRSDKELAARFRLTPREIQVARLLTRGTSTREIASVLGASVNTARRHIERILEKLDVHSRAAAVAKVLGPLDVS
jgi:DNA-binding NarL/FixJ family response regulator